MAEVTEVDLLQRRFSEASEYFRSLWTFHQFLRGLTKIFVQERIETGDVDFDTPYEKLRQVSAAISAAEWLKADEILDGIERSLTEIHQQLIGLDRQVSASRLRVFFRRAKQIEEKVFRQMIAFYLYSQHTRPWTDEETDKLDLLITQLAKKTSGPTLAANRVRLLQLAQSFWRLADLPNPVQEDLDRRREALYALRGELDEVQTLSEFEAKRLVERYRALKHDVGLQLAHPDLLLQCVEMNVRFQEVIHRLYQQEQQTIFGEYERIASYGSKERADDATLHQALDDFRTDLESFEENVRNQDFRLGEVAVLRERVGRLLPHLAEAASMPELEKAEEPEAPSPPALVVAADEMALVHEDYDELLDVLGKFDQDAPPASVIFSSELFPYRLEGREVEAYRRVADSEPEEHPVERFLLVAAALRRLLKRQLDEIRELEMDEIEMPGDEAILVAARAALQMAQVCSYRYQVLFQASVWRDDLDEARSLERLRMRMMREYSGVWLQVYR